MSPMAQRVALAEACGWKCTVTTWRSPEFSRWARTVERNGAIEQIDDSHILPDYLNDLNAIQEAEKILTVDQFEKYLRYIVPEEQNWIKYPINAYWRLRHAEARECLSALVRTLNLWDDSK